MLHATRHFATNQNAFLNAQEINLDFICAPHSPQALALSLELQICLLDRKCVEISTEMNTHTSALDMCVCVCGFADKTAHTHTHTRTSQFHYIVAGSSSI